MALIEIQDLSFRYRDTTELALDHVSLAIEPGEFVGIIGSTGAGKSTLCWTIVGVIPQILRGGYGGTVTVKGLPSKTTPISTITQSVGLVQQDAEAQLLMTDVEKEIIFPLENLGLPRAEISKRLENALEITNLHSNRLRHPFYLSGGQKQRVAVAAALAMQPEILILDEATSELDPLGAEEIHNLAGSLKKQGKTILMVEHNIDELAKHADRIIVLHKGKKVRDGDTKAVLSDVEFLIELGIYPPQVTQVAYELKARGYLLRDELPLTLQDTLRVLTEMGARV